jgi:hypothetical protein
VDGVYLRDAYRPQQDAWRGIALSALRNALGQLRKVSDGEPRFLASGNGWSVADMRFSR